MVISYFLFIMSLLQWSSRNLADCAITKWSSRNFAYHAITKWSSRNFAYHAITLWSSRNMAYYAITKWSSRNLAIYAITKWSSRNLASEVGTQCNRFKPSSKIFYWPFQDGTSFVDHLCYLCIVFVMLSGLFIAALWSPGGERADLLALVFDVIVIL